MLSTKLMTSSRSLLGMSKFGSEPLLSFGSVKIPQCTVNSQQCDEYLQIIPRRNFHVSFSKRDMEAAFKAIGGGIAALGVIGPGIGIGHIFGNVCLATARNPSMANKFFQLGIMGAAFCESLALFALMISFLALL